jgi:DNA-binding XRE family transcriptional regulator
MSCQKKGTHYAKKHGDYKTRLYRIWLGLKHRRYKVYNPVVCEEWKDFTAFKTWALSNGYADDLTIDRIDNKGDYTPENCQWIPHRENCGKDKRIFSYSEKIDIYKKRKQLGITQRDMAKRLGVSRNTIQRLERDIKNDNL